MAYVSQDKKAALAPAIKAVLKKYGMKGTIAVQHHSTLVVNLKSGKLDLAKGEKYVQVNPYWADKWAEEAGEKKIARFYRELFSAMKGPEFFDESDSMTDYFHCSHYIDVNVGKWNKPYELTA